MIERNVNILKYIDFGESFFLFGGRGTGKSSLLQSLLDTRKNKLCFDLLESSQFTRYLINPSLMKEEIELALKKSSEKLIIFIDEIQKIPIILDDIHFLIEKYKQKVQFILTGSSARKLKAKGVNLLAGRALVFSLFPFTVDELGDDFNLYETLRFGSLPLIYEKIPEIKIKMLQAYTEIYLREEIKNEALTRNIQSFSQFLDLAAQLNGEIVNYSKMGRQCHTFPNTIIAYYQILFDTLTAIELPAGERSVKNN